MNEQVNKLYRFLNAAKGNWRNSIFITCDDCTYGEETLCPGYLFIADADGQPILISVETIHKASGVYPEKEECQARLSRQQFQTAYSQWLDWSVEDLYQCPLRMTSVNGTYSNNTDRLRRVCKRRGVYCEKENGP